MGHGTLVAGIMAAKANNGLGIAGINPDVEVATYSTKLSRENITDLIKGYEFEKGRYVIVTDEDMQKVRVESTRVINLVQFADAAEIDPIYVDRAYYLAPDGPMAAEAFAVMRDGMTGKAGIGKVALYGREYLVAIKPRKPQRRRSLGPAADKVKGSFDGSSAGKRAWIAARSGYTMSEASATRIQGHGRRA